MAAPARLIAGRLIRTLAAWPLADGGELRLRTIDGALDLRIFERIPGSVHSATRDGLSIPQELAAELSEALREAAR